MFLQFIKATVLERLGADDRLTIIGCINPRTQEAERDVHLQEIQPFPDIRLLDKLMQQIRQISDTDIDGNVILFLQSPYRLIKGFRLSKRKTKIDYRILSICHHRNHNIPYIHPRFPMLYAQVKDTEKPIIFIGRHSLVKHSV